MRKYSLFVWASLPFLLACHEYEWVKKGASFNQRAKAIEACKATQLRPDVNTPFFVQCMKVKGWVYRPVLRDTSYQSQSPDEDYEEYPETFDG